MNAKKLTPSQDQMAQAVRFRRAAERIAEFGDSIGVKIVPYESHAVTSFLALENSGPALGHLENFVAICEDTIDRGHSLRNEPQLLWSALKRYGLRPTSDLFRFIDNRRVVEIHSSDFVQVFRNFTFFEYCSYSLETLISNPWNRLYRRDPAIEQQLLDYGRRAFGGEFSSTVPMTVPRHRIEELQSPRRFLLTAEVNFGSPLYCERTGIIKATAVIETVEFEKRPRFGNALFRADSSPSL